MNSFDEHSIYNLLAVEDAKEIKPSIYASKFTYGVKQEYTAGQEVNKTMGPAKVFPPQPQNFLKKGVKEPRFAKKKSFHYPDEIRNKPPIPKIGDMSLNGLRTTRNLICVNTDKNNTSLPKPPKQRSVDTRHGDIYNLIQSGLDPIYVHKKGFGEVPAYISKRKEEMRRAQDEYDRCVAENFKQGSLRQLTAEEHAAVLDGLKINYNDLQDRYENMSVVIDSIAKKSRNERIEAQIKQLEQDIELLEKHQIVYIGK